LNLALEKPLLIISENKILEFRHNWYEWSPLKAFFPSEMMCCNKHPINQILRSIGRDLENSQLIEM
jgi:hypothetical protein